MSAWIKLDPERFGEREAKSAARDGVHIEVRMSPYDIPDAMRGNYDDNIDRFVIEFRYIGDEPWQSRSVAEHIVARVGRHSGRIYALEINIKALGAKNAESVEFSLLPAVNEGIDHLAGKAANKGILSDRYKIAKQAIQEAGRLLPDASWLTPAKATAR